MALTNTTGEHSQSTSLAQMDDAALVQAAREDIAAFDALYRRYVTRIYRYCYSRTENAAVAEDLTAQTFLAALESIGTFRGDGSVALLEAYFGALSADGQRLYVLTRDGRVAIFSVPDLVLSETITLSAGGGPERIQDYGGRAVLSPDGSRLYLNDRGHPETLYAIDTMTWQTVAQVRLAEAEPVYDLALSSDGKHLFMLSMHNSLQLSMWDAMTLSRQAVTVEEGAFV